MAKYEMIVDIEALALDALMKQDLPLEFHILEPGNLELDDKVVSIRGKKKDLVQFCREQAQPRKLKLKELAELVTKMEKQ